MSLLDLSWLKSKSKLIDQQEPTKVESAPAPKDWLAQPDRCDQEVWEKGIGVFLITGGTSQAIEGLVQRCASDLGLKVDWNYIGGRAIVRVIGDESVQTQVAEWMESNLPMSGYRI